MGGFEPVIIGFCCHWCAYAGADAAGRAGKPVPAGFRVVRVPCSGRVEPEWVLSAFAAGADGVLVLGCPPDSCHYRRGNIEALKRVSFLAAVLEPMGIAPSRLKRAGVGADDADGFIRVVTEAVDGIRSLGPFKPQGGARHARS